MKFLILFPLLGLATTEEACGPYLQATNMLFMASLMVAISMECSGLHKRIALKVLMIVGNDIRRLFAGFMFTTMFLGIWIINTAATAMILPIADVISKEILTEEEYKDDLQLNESQSDDRNHHDLSIQLFLSVDKEVYVLKHNSKQLRSAKNDKLRRLLYISIAYSATIGGTTTLTSNGPNLVLRFVLDEESEVSQITKAPKHIIKEKYRELGSITFHESAVCFLFVLLIVLWMLRDPQFLKGWATIITNNIKPKDATAAIFIVVLMFCIPAKPMDSFPGPTLLDWQTVEKKLAWGVIILRGGGFSMADTASKSGLTKLIGTQLTHLDVLSLVGIVIIMSLLATIFTELASNSAIATIFLPIAGQLATSLEINPLVLMIPITLSCSYAFVLPVGTPANALVFNHAKLRATDMTVNATYE
ncbi:unnamed protein product [Oppiella nova]|uniref:Uncharacterized protein n=1 Tax=Oppiella nova TaxID=334625 RepID=A0A7R9QD34_9ACAR|nr:unnamed protein product [Oppiella nova]CAG2162894.1 unnamed protein product [Oppiella nova]